MSSGDRRDAAGRVRSAHGPLALEELLRADVLADRDRVRADPRLLAQPLVIVVPSRSLRLHLARRLVDWTGGACAGVEVLTIAGTARAVLAAADERPPRGALLFETLVAEALRADPDLARELDAFDEVERSVAATLRDLFDARFASSAAPALSAVLGENASIALGTPAELQRSKALVRLAADVERRAALASVDIGAGAFRRATLVIAEREHAFPARGLWIVGFADATGAALDLLEALLRRPGARIFADALADAAFGASLRARLSIPARREHDAIERPVVSLLRAPSVDSEVRAAVNRIRTDVDRGLAPESIAIVARDLAPYRVALRRHLGRLAVPYSVVGASGSLGPAERRIRALAELFRAKNECDLSRWIDARASEGATSAGREAIVGAALRALGAADLGALCALDLGARLAGGGALRLPLRAASSLFEKHETEEVGDEEEDDGEAEDAGGEYVPVAMVTKLARIEVTRTDLERELDVARRTSARLAEWVAKATVGDHLRSVRSFVADVLSWTALTPGRAQLDEALAAIARDTPPDLELSRAALFAVLALALDDESVPPLGSDGGGIHVLDATEARGRTFAVLHVLGLARGRFPRVVREDPLLSDALRGRLASVLPDLPQKATGRDEERVLFEALIRAAPVVHASWPTLDDDGKALLPSALLEHVASRADITDAPIADEALSKRSSSWTCVRPAHEHLVVSALHDRRAAFDELVALVIEEARTALGLDSTPSADIARGRSSILAEFEPAPLDRGRLGPYFGFVGSADTAQDLRAKDPYVSHLEALGGCGWQAFLKYVLRLEPPFDPAADLPDVDPRLVGDVVHAVLRRVVDRRLERVVWPKPEALEQLVFEEARSALRERGILLAGFDSLVVSRVRPLIDAAQSLDRREGVATVSQSEIEGSIPIAEGFLGARRLAFRADRRDEVSGTLRYTDFKTGKPKSKAMEPDGRLKSLIKDITYGRKLQAIVYARHAGEGGTGRYVHLEESLPDELRAFPVARDEAEANTALDAALEVLLGAWDLGTFTPRMLADNLARDGELCGSCEVKIACLRGDSTAHRRLKEFVERASTQANPALDATLELWTIGRGEAQCEKPKKKAPKKEQS